MGSCFEFHPNLLVLTFFSVLTWTGLPSEQVGPISQGHKFLPCLNFPKETEAQESLNQINLAKCLKEERTDLRLESLDSAIVVTKAYPNWTYFRFRLQRGERNKEEEKGG